MGDRPLTPEKEAAVALAALSAPFDEIGYLRAKLAETTEIAKRLEAERDRLAQILACERGETAPEGWRWDAVRRLTAEVDRLTAERDTLRAEVDRLTLVTTEQAAVLDAVEHALDESRPSPTATTPCGATSTELHASEAEAGDAVRVIVARCGGAS